MSNASISREEDNREISTLLMRIMRFLWESGCFLSKFSK